MPAFREGKVTEILEERPGLQRARVALVEPQEEIVASCYEGLLPLGIGDLVIVNTTGLELGLGTGGEGFVVWVNGEGRTHLGDGHIIKLRYTPWQMEVMAAEAPESEHHELLVDADSIEGLPVVACGLHSQIAGVAAGIKAQRPNARVGYLMSDAGSLPLAWSDLVATLTGKGLLDITCTYGHAFGGDIEAVNVFSGLCALREVGGVDIAIAAMGPGGVGTATKLGYSGIEQAQVLDATGALRGTSIACVRISFSDDRDRHQGISHHSLTSLTMAARPVTVVVPVLPDGQADVVRGQLEQVGMPERHRIRVEDGSAGVRLLEGLGIEVQTMGRSVAQAPEPFLAAAAAGVAAARALE